VVELIKHLCQSHWGFRRVNGNSAMVLLAFPLIFLVAGECELYLATIRTRELNRLLTDAEAGKFSVVLVWKLDRLGRSLIHLVRLMEDFQRLGIELMSFSEGLDFTTTTGKLLYQIISAFADHVERTIMRSHWAEVPLD
jgi:hypothetical protein